MYMKRRSRIWSDQAMEAMATPAQKPHERQNLCWMEPNSWKFLGWHQILGIGPTVQWGAAATQPKGSQRKKTFPLKHLN